jgi:CheY-like chemotaxis protein
MIHGTGYAPALVMTNNASAQPLILVADDDREARELLAEVLEGECYPVAQAENGQRALSSSKSGRHA